MEDETHENINDEINEEELYEIDRLSIDENKLCKHAFESGIKIIYDMKRLNGMNHIHNNKVNKQSGCNLLHDIPNSSKRT